MPCLKEYGSKFIHFLGKPSASRTHTDHPAQLRGPVMPVSNVFQREKTKLSAEGEMDFKLLLALGPGSLASKQKG